MNRRDVAEALGNRDQGSTAWFTLRDCDAPAQTWMVVSEQLRLVVLSVCAADKIHRHGGSTLRWVSVWRVHSEPAEGRATGHFEMLHEEHGSGPDACADLWGSPHVKPAFMGDASPVLVVPGTACLNLVHVLERCIVGVVACPGVKRTLQVLASPVSVVKLRGHGAVFSPFAIVVLQDFGVCTGLFVYRYPPAVVTDRARALLPRRFDAERLMMDVEQVTLMRLESDASLGRLMLTLRRQTPFRCRVETWCVHGTRVREIRKDSRWFVPRADVCAGVMVSEDGTSHLMEGDAASGTVYCTSIGRGRRRHDRIGAVDLVGGGSRLHQLAVLPGVGLLSYQLASAVGDGSVRGHLCLHEAIRQGTGRARGTDLGSIGRLLLRLALSE
jgi:hypothetical protein